MNRIWIKRAVRTFLQAFLGYVVVNIALVDFSDGKQAIKTALTGLGVSAIAAGLSAVMNLKGDDNNEDGSMGEEKSRQGD